MGEPVSIAKTFTLAAGASERLAVYGVPPARVLIVSRMCVYFPSGTSNMVGVKLLHGIAQALPREGEVRADSGRVCVEGTARYESGSSVVVEATNYDTANPHSFTVEVEGELL